MDSYEQRLFFFDALKHANLVTAYVSQDAEQFEKSLTDWKQAMTLLFAQADAAEEHALMLQELNDGLEEQNAQILEQLQELHDRRQHAVTIRKKIVRLAELEETISMLPEDLDTEIETLNSDTKRTQADIAVLEQQLHRRHQALAVCAHILQLAGDGDVPELDSMFETVPVYTEVPTDKEDTVEAPSMEEVHDTTEKSEDTQIDSILHGSNDELDLDYQESTLDETNPKTAGTEVSTLDLLLNAAEHDEDEDDEDYVFDMDE